MIDVTPSPPPEKRRLAAVVFTDVVGYSARMQRNEAATISGVEADFERMRTLCVEHGGEVLNTMGDGLMLCFPSVVKGVSFALKVQGEFAARRPSSPEALEHRIGVHLGDVISLENGGVAGDGVNIASRLEAKAPVGGICISQTVYDTVNGKVPMQATFVGPLSFKNIAQPIPVWHVMPEGMAGAADTRAAAMKHPARRPQTKRWLLAALAAVLLVSVAAGGWLWSRRDAPVTQPGGGMDRTTARILVLPFSTQASAMEGKDALFASGITDDVSGGLGRFSSLRVMGRTTSTALQASNVEHAVLREKYGVNYILSGTFRISGDKFRLNLELVETGAGTTVWSKRFDGPLAQVVDVDDQVVRSIVGRVASQVMQSDLRQSRNSTPAKLSAYEFTLQARHLWKTPTRETLPQAQSLLRKAIDVEPAYAPAYAYLAFTNLTSYNNSWAEGFSKIETLHNMLASASMAVELEPMNGTAHAAKAIAQTYLGSHSEALAAAREALRFNGSDSDTLGRVGQVLTFLGEHEEAIKALQLAIDLDPFGPAQFHNFLSRAHFFIRNYEEATTHARICLQRANIEPCRETLAAALSYLHRPEEAAMAWNDITRKQGDVEPEEMVSRLRRAFKRHEDIEHLILGLKQARESARVAAVPKQ